MPVFYISPTGSDSGSCTRSNPGRSFGHVRDVIRSSGANVDMTSDLYVMVAPGSYPQTETLTFAPEDSGSNGYKIIYRAYNGYGSAWISGGQRITDWTDDGGGVYWAPVTGDFWTVYENGRRARVARYPHYVHDPDFPCAQTPYFRTEEGLGEQYASLQHAAADLSGLTPASWNLADLQVWMWSGGRWNWFTDQTPVTSYTAGTRRFVLAHEPRHYIWQDVGSRYYLQGVREFLEEAGEWYHDRVANRLYYMPMDGAIADQEIVIPVCGPKVVAFVGDDENTRVHDIIFDGITIQYGDFVEWFRYAEWGVIAAGENPTAGAGHDWPHYAHEYSLTAHQQGMVYTENANDIEIKNAHLLDSGYSAVYSIEHGQGLTLANVLIEHAGESGWHLEGRYPGEGDILKNNQIRDFLIRNFGETVGHGAGVYIANSGSNRVRRGDISNAPRNGVFVTSWVGIDPEDIYAQGNVIELLRLHALNQDSGDVGSLGWTFLSSVSPDFVVNRASQLLIDHSEANATMTDNAPNAVLNDLETAGQWMRNIWATDIQGVEWRAADGTGEDHDEVNVSWGGGFSSALMLTSLIKPAPCFSWNGDSFEWTGATAKNWTVGYGSALLSLARPRTGFRSWRPLTDQAVIYRTFPIRYTGAVTVYFYDAGAASQATMARADLGPWDDLTTARGLGIDTDVSATKYVYRVGAAVTATAIDRTTGWHKLTWSYDGSACSMAIDDVEVATPAGVARWSTIALGDWWADGVNAEAYFDDVSWVVT